MAKGGCRTEVAETPPAPAWQAHLEGARVWQRRPAGLVPWFDAQQGPVVRVDRAGCSTCAVRIDGDSARALRCTTEARGEATLMRCAAPPTARGDATLHLVGEGRTHARWPVHFATPPAEVPGVDAVMRHRAAGETEAAQAALAVLPDRPAARLWGGLERARLASASGDTAATIEAWTRAAGEAEALGFPSEQARRLFSAMFFALHAHDLVRAAALHARATGLGLGDATHRFDAAYYDGLLAVALGDYRQAAARLRRAVAVAEGVGADPRAHMAREALAARVLLDLGHDAEALASLEAARPWVERDGGPADRARLAVNLAFARLHAAAQRDDAEARRAARAAADAARVAVDAAGLDRLRADTWANLAWAEHLVDRPAEASRALTAARAAQQAHGGMLSPSFLDLLEGELALTRGDAAAAAAAFGRQVDAGRGSEAAWRARYGLGRAAALGGETDDALGHYRAALKALDAVARRVAVRRDRARFLAQRGDLVADTIDALRAAGATNEAFAVADGARARVLRALAAQVRVRRLPATAQAGWQEKAGRYQAAREAWQGAVANPPPMSDAARAQHRAEVRRLAEARDAAFDAAIAWLDTQSPDATPEAADADAVREALAPGEALLALAPHRGGWLAFRVTASGISLAPVRAGEALWPDLEGVRHLHVVAGGHEGALGLPAAVIDAGVSVGFLPHAGFLLRDPLPFGGGSLVVADPGDDLPFARRDAQTVPSSRPHRVLVGAAATHAAVSVALEGARLVHFAGHGVLRPEDPWDAHLRLAGGEALTLAEVLAGRTPGAMVVLSGCRTGAGAVLAREDEVGLPEAFLAAGARTVLATDRDIPDRDAARFAEAFYGAGGAEAPARALVAAARALRAEGSGAWAAWRLVGLPGVAERGDGAREPSKSGPAPTQPASRGAVVR